MKPAAKLNSTRLYGLDLFDLPRRSCGSPKRIEKTFNFLEIPPGELSGESLECQFDQMRIECGSVTRLMISVLRPLGHFEL